MNQQEAERKQFLTLIWHWHANHPRVNQIEHCVNVAHWVERALDAEPAPVPTRRDLILAALGHDLYEDSKVDRAQIVAGYGSEVDRLIEGVTERNGVAEFVERVATGSEGARLIKLADGIDNYGGLRRNGLLREEPAKWVEIVRTLMEPMFSRLEGIPFSKYPSAGAMLSQELGKQRELFWAEVASIGK